MNYLLKKDLLVVSTRLLAGRGFPGKCSCFLSELSWFTLINAAISLGQAALFFFYSSLLLCLVSV